MVLRLSWAKKTLWGGGKGWLPVGRQFFLLIVSVHRRWSGQFRYLVLSGTGVGVVFMIFMRRGLEIWLHWLSGVRLDYESVFLCFFARVNVRTYKSVYVCEFVCLCVCIYLSVWVCARACRVLKKENVLKAPEIWEGRGGKFWSTLTIFCPDQEDFGETPSLFMGAHCRFCHDCGKFFWKGG